MATPSAMAPVNQKPPVGHMLLTDVPESNYREPAGGAW